MREPQLEQLEHAEEPADRCPGTPSRYWTPIMRQLTAHIGGTAK